jgi:hypothetical protein
MRASLVLLALQIAELDNWQDAIQPALTFVHSCALVLFNLFYLPGYFFRVFLPPINIKVSHFFNLKCSEIQFPYS